jgi:hypothetical protein
LLSGHLPLQPTQLQLDVAATTVQIVSFLIGQPARFLQLFQSIFFISAPERDRKKKKIDDTAITADLMDMFRFSKEKYTLDIPLMKNIQFMRKKFN